MIINAYEIFGNIIFLFKQMKRIDLSNAMVLYAIGHLFLPLYVSFSSCRCTRFIWFSRTRFRLTFCGHVVCCYGLNDDFYFFHKRVVNVWSHYRPKIQINNIWLTLTTPSLCHWTLSIMWISISFLFLEKNVDYFLANSLVFVICLTEKTWLIVIRND
jgi:hypothetical protein